MSLHVGTSYSLPAPSGGYSRFPSPALTVSGEPEGVALNVALHLHITHCFWDTLGPVHLRLPDGEYLQMMNIFEAALGADPADPFELGRASQPFVLRDRRKHYRDRFTPSQQPLDGTVEFRPDQETWSIGKYTTVNGDYALTIQDFGAESLHGVAPSVAYWALSFGPVGVGAGRVSKTALGDTRVGVVSL